MGRVVLGTTPYRPFAAVSIGDDVPARDAFVLTFNEIDALGHFGAVPHPDLTVRMPGFETGAHLLIDETPR